MKTFRNRALIIGGGPLLSAFLFFSAMPDLSFAPLAFVALIPLFMALETTDSFMDNLWISLSWGFFFSLFMGFFLKFAVIDHYGFSWFIFILFFIFGVALPNSLIFLFFSTSIFYLKPDKRGGDLRAGLFRVTVVPGLWILHEYIKETVPFSLPWANYGYTLSGSTLLIQAADLGGIYLLSFIVAAVNSSGTSLLRGLIDSKKKNFSSLIRPVNLVYLSGMVFLTGFLFIYGWFSIRSVDREAASGEAGLFKIKASAVQASHSNKERWDRSGQFMTLADYVELSGFNRETPSLTVWPETIITSPGHLNSQLYGSLAALLHERSVLIAGAVRPGTGAGTQHNSAMIIGGDLTLAWYDKVILLPFSETAPLGLGFGSIYDAPSEFTPGIRQRPLNSPMGKLSVSICFEIMYPYLQREAVKEGADYLVNISNDSWFGDASQPMTHLAGAAMRCVENRRYMVRASNSGYSAVIDPAGRIVKSALHARERVSGEIYPVRGLTLYSRLGDWIVIAAVLLVLISAFLSNRGSD